MTNTNTLFNKTIFFLISLILFLKPIYAVNIFQDPNAVFYYNKGEEFISKGDTLAAIEAFETAIQKDRKFSKAYHRLAQIHLSIGKLNNRVKARNYIEKAVRYDPKNINYLHTKLELYYHIRFYYTAKRIAEKILKINKKDARALYLLGRMSELQWLRYEDMLDIKEVSSDQNDGSRVIVYYSDFANKDLKEALDFYKKAIISDPTFSDAYYRFAFICYEKKLYKRMEEILLEAINVAPGNKDYFQFLGLCYFRMNRISESVDAFNKAISLMLPEELVFIEAVDLVSTPKEGEEFNEANIEKRIELQYKFWKKRDPLFLTEGNERKLEHYGRMAYANLRFSNKLKGVSGWQTPQGNVYIRFGPPINHFKTWPKISEKKGSSGFNGLDARFNQRVYFSENIQNNSGGNYPVKHSEATWFYPGFSIKFEDINFDGHYNFYNRSQFNDLIKKQPEKFEYLNPSKQLKFNFSFARFRNDNNENILEVYQELPQTEITAPDTSMVRGIFLFDKNWKEVTKTIIQDPYFSNCNDSLLIGWDRLQVLPGTYNLIVEFMNRHNGKAGQLRKEIVLPDDEENDFCMSDIVLARKIENYQGEKELTHGEMKIVPNVSLEYPIDSVIPIFFEIYNLTFNSDGKTNYKVTFAIKSSDGENKRGIIQRIFGQEKTSTQIGTSYEYSGNSHTDFIYHFLSITDPKKIKYHLIVEIEDLNSNKIVYREVTFLLK